MVSTSSPDVSGRLGALVSHRRETIRAIRALASQVRYVVFYGCGALQEELRRVWDRFIGRPIDFTCDADPAKWGRTFCGTACLSPADLETIKTQCAVFITITEVEGLIPAFQKAGFPSVQALAPMDLWASDVLGRLSNAEVLGALEVLTLDLEPRPNPKTLERVLQELLEGPQGGAFIRDLEGDQEAARTRLAEHLENDRFEHQTLAWRTGPESLFSSHSRGLP